MLSRASSPVEVDLAETVGEHRSEIDSPRHGRSSTTRSAAQATSDDLCEPRRADAHRRALGRPQRVADRRAHQLVDAARHDRADRGSQSRPRTRSECRPTAPRSLPELPPASERRDRTTVARRCRRTLLNAAQSSMSAFTRSHSPNLRPGRPHAPSQIASLHILQVVQTAGHEHRQRRTDQQMIDVDAACLDHPAPLVVVAPSAGCRVRARGRCANRS